MIGAALAMLAALFVYFGAFDVAADVPHSAFVYTVIQAVRDRSIAVRIKNIEVPPLNDPNLIADGAKHYDAMCADCHLAPGAEQSELHEGLYPQPPDLTKQIDAGSAERFWVIKHGLKMSAMPAWGKTHDDQSIWGLVAFLEKLPQLTADQYHDLVKVRGETLRHSHQHTHNRDGENEHHD